MESQDQLELEVARELEQRGIKAPSPEAFSELVELRRQIATTAKETEKMEREARKIERQTLDLKRSQAIREAAKDRFYDVAVVEQLLKDSVRWDADEQRFIIDSGKGFPKLNSSFQPKSIAEEIDDLATSKPFLVKNTEQSSTAHAPARQNDPLDAIKSKADFRRGPNGLADPQMVSRFVSERGYEAFAKLPIKS